MPLRDLNLAPGFELFTLQNPEVGGAIVGNRFHGFQGGTPQAINAGASAEVSAQFNFNGTPLSLFKPQDVLVLEDVIAAMQSDGTEAYAVSSGTLYLADSVTGVIRDLAPSLALTPFIGTGGIGAADVDSPVIEAGPIVWTYADLVAMEAARLSRPLAQPLRVIFNCVVTNNGAALHNFAATIAVQARQVTGVNP